MSAQSDQSSMAWIAYSLMTVAAWGVYGIFLHSGQAEMKDPLLGRYKAFLFVGIAYFLTAVLAPLVLLWMKEPTGASRPPARGGRSLRASSARPARLPRCWPSGPAASPRW